MTTAKLAEQAARFVGQSVKRREDPRLLSGRGRYVDDIVLPGMLHLGFVRSHAARGLITNLDTKRAAELEGVVAVLTARDLNVGAGGMWATASGPPVGPTINKPLADDDVRFVGDPVAVVVAEDRYIAEDACELVELDVDALAPILGYEAPLDPAVGLVHAELGSNVAAHSARTSGSGVDEVFRTAPHVVTRTFRMARATNVPMEGRAMIASWDPSTGEMTIWSSTQSPHEIRAYAARLLGIADHLVHVKVGDVGGGFGQKMYPTREEACVLLTARRIGRPVKWVEDRRENLVAAGHARAQEATVSAAVDDAGTILAFRVSHLEDSGAYPVCGPSSAALMNLVFTGPYRVGAYDFESTAMYTNTCGRTAYRGPWLMETVCREQMVDHVARELGLDPLDVRRRNVIKAAHQPYQSANGTVYDGVSVDECLELAAKIVGWDEFRRRQAELREQGRYIGVGVALYIEPSAVAFGTWATEEVALRLTPGGKVVVSAGTGSHGHSLETTVPQVVADALGCAFEDVIFLQGDTDSTPFGQGTGGSRSAVIVSGAAMGASQTLRTKVLGIAAQLLEAAPEDLSMDDSIIRVAGVPTIAVSLADVARAVHFAPATLADRVGNELVASHRFRPETTMTWSNACHACVCEVDPETGYVTLERFIVTEDCGVMINPMVVEGQIAGGVAQGIGGALFEDFTYDADGNPLGATMLDYTLPLASDVPDIEYGHIETPSNNPGGFRGMGEGGAIGAPPAVANAIADALAPFGVVLTNFPFSPPRILDAMARARARSALS